MTKKNIILITIITFIILSSIFLYSYFSGGVNNNKNNTEPTEDLPFGITENPEKDTDHQQETFSLDNLFRKSSSTEYDNINNIKLRQIYKKPVSGAFFKESNTLTNIIFLDRASGNVFGYTTNTPTIEPVRLTNTTISKTQESIFFNEGQNIILRFLDDNNKVLSFIGKISTSSDQNIGEIKGDFLTEDIKQIVISPDNKNIFELVENSKGGVSGYFYPTLTINNKKEIFYSPITSWNISWPKKETITFTTKPTYKESGFLFFFNNDTLSFDRIIGEIVGLTTNTSPTTNLVAYSENKKDSLKLSIYDIKNMENKNISINTISDKCIWGRKNTEILYCAVPKNIPKGKYPDDWYQGNVSFEDSFWQIDTTSGTTKNIYENSGLNIDSTNLQIDEKDQYISFINKNDLSLWLLDLSEKQ